MPASDLPSWLGPRAAVRLVIAFVLVALGCWLICTPEQIEVHLSEEGRVEEATAALFLLNAVLVWRVRDGSAPMRTWAALSILFMAFGLRELEWHKAWTGSSVLKVSFYLGAAAPLQKAAALLVLSLVAWAAMHLLWRYAGKAWQGFRRGEAVATTALVFVMTMAATKALDRSLNTVYELSRHRPAPWLYALQAPLEEITELSLPVLLLLGMLQYRLQRRSFRSQGIDRAQRRWRRHAALVATVLACAAAGWAWYQRDAEAQRARQARIAEAQRIGAAMHRAAEAAQQAWIATTPPEVRAAQQAKALAEFRAAEQEMRLEQTAALEAQRARKAAASNANGRKADAPRP